MAKEREACGRCSVSVAVEAATDPEADRSDPFGEERIEVEEGQLRTLSPDGWIAGLSSRIDDVGQRLIWGR